MSARTCWLHVGTHKTGTTWIQAMLQSNEEMLSRQGYYLPKTGRTNDDLAAQHALAWALAAPQGGSKLLGELALELGRSPDHHVIMSTEDFEQLIFSPHSLRELKDVIEACGLQPRVLIFVREPISYVNALYVEGVKHNSIASRERFFADVQSDYRRIVQGFCAVFGRHNVCCKPYQARVERTFFEVIGADSRELREPSDCFAHRNFSLGMIGMLAVRHYYRLTAARGLGEKEVVLGSRLLMELCAKIEKRKFVALSREEAAAIEERFAEDRRWLHQEHGVTLPYYSGRMRENTFGERVRTRIASVPACVLAITALILVAGSRIVGARGDLGCRSV